MAYGTLELTFHFYGYPKNTVLAGSVWDREEASKLGRVYRLLKTVFSIIHFFLSRVLLLL